MERHLHGYGERNPEGVLMQGGARLKDNRDTHLDAGIIVSHTTQELARFIVETTPSGIQAQLLQCVNNEWLVTSPSPWSTQITRRPAILPGSQGAVSADHSIAIFDTKTSPILPTSETIVLPFLAELPIGVCLSLLQRWE